MNYTPGPWRSLRVGLNENPNVEHTIWTRREDASGGVSGGILATTDGCYDQDKNAWNSWIMAASPELFESLKELVDVLITNNLQDHPMVEGAAKKAYDLVAKVEKGVA